MNLEACYSERKYERPRLERVEVRREHHLGGLSSLVARLDGLLCPDDDLVDGPPEKGKSAQGHSDDDEPHDPS